MLMLRWIEMNLRLINYVRVKMRRESNNCECTTSSQWVTSSARTGIQRGHDLFMRSNLYTKWRHGGKALKVEKVHDEYYFGGPAQKWVTGCTRETCLFACTLINLGAMISRELEDRPASNHHFTWRRDYVVDDKKDEISQWRGRWQLMDDTTW